VKKVPSGLRGASGGLKAPFVELIERFDVEAVIRKPSRNSRESEVLREELDAEVVALVRDGTRTLSRLSLAGTSKSSITTSSSSACSPSLRSPLLVKGRDLHRDAAGLEEGGLLIGETAPRRE
jgi:hypothetical protein